MVSSWHDFSFLSLILIYSILAAAGLSKGYSFSSWWPLCSNHRIKFVVIVMKSASSVFCIQYR